MSKLFNVRLPNASQQQYSAEAFNQLVRSLEQVILQLNSTYGSDYDQSLSGAASWFTTGGAGGGGFSAGIRGPQLSNGITLPYAMLMSDQDQSSAGITSENLITYNQVVLSRGITVESNSRIKVPCSGQYLVSFSLQVTNRGNAVQEFEVWAKSTGSNYPLSNTRFDIPARKSSTVWAHIVPSIAGIFTVEDPSTEYLELAWWSDSVDVFLEHYSANTSPTRPAIPSVIAVVHFISAI
jgi:hypothetical protein